MNAETVRARLQALGLPAGGYVLHSSASLVLRGVLDEAGDVDVVCDADAWRVALGLVEAGAATLDLGRHDLRVSVGDDAELYDGWFGEPGDAVVARAELVAGVPCAPLAEVVAFKERLGRPKDHVHLAAIRRFQERQRG